MWLHVSVNEKMRWLSCAPCIPSDIPSHLRTIFAARGVHKLQFSPSLPLQCLCHHFPARGCGRLIHFNGQNCIGWQGLSKYDVLGVSSLIHRIGYHQELIRIKWACIVMELKNSIKKGRQHICISLCVLHAPDRTWIGFHCHFKWNKMSFFLGA